MNGWSKAMSVVYKRWLFNGRRVVTKEVDTQDLYIRRRIIEIYKQFVKIVVVTSFDLIYVFVEVDDIGNGATIT